MKKPKSYFVPVTPGGTPIPYGIKVDVIAATTREQAIKNLFEDAFHMPYRAWKEFEKRGYTILMHEDDFK